MNDFNAMLRVTSAAMAAEQLRLEVVAYNLAHQHDSTSPTIAAKTVTGKLKPFETFIRGEGPQAAYAQLQVQDLPPSTQQVWEPDNPNADEKGFVHYPDIDSVQEMTNLMRASRAYEADLRLFNLFHHSYGQMLTLGESR